MKSSGFSPRSENMGAGTLCSSGQRNIFVGMMSQASSAYWFFMISWMFVWPYACHQGDISVAIGICLC
jgi:hypothetical protein